jgi:hypothetical protein
MVEQVLMFKYSVFKRSLIYQRLPDIPWAITASLSIALPCFPLLSCNHSLYMNVDSDSHVTVSASSTHFWLVDIPYSLQMNTTVGRDWKELSTIIPTNIGTLSPGLSVAIYVGC